MVLTDTLGSVAAGDVFWAKRLNNLGANLLAPAQMLGGG